MKQLLPDEQVRNKNANQPWMKSETDRMLDLYLSGWPPTRVAVAMGRNPKAIARRLEMFAYNEKGFVERYTPRRRISRKNKPMTTNEHAWIKTYRDRSLSMKLLAKVLQREVQELGLEDNERSKLSDMKQVGVGVDLVLAYRYLYYVQGISILSDAAYDKLEKEELEFGARGNLLKKNPSSDRKEDYAPHIRALAIYLVFKYGCGKEKKKDEA